MEKTKSISIPMSEALIQDLPPIVKFYLPERKNERDHKGRTRAEILAWSDDELEYCHEYAIFSIPCISHPLVTA